eukprot:3010398-Prymnesium_polylepis.2
MLAVFDDDFPKRLVVQVVDGRSLTGERRLEQHVVDHCQQQLASTRHGTDERHRAMDVHKVVASVCYFRVF